MGWCQAIVLVTFIAILQCDLSQTAGCNCKNRRPRTIQFRIPNFDTPRNYPFNFPMPYPYFNANNQPSATQRKCITPRCNTRLQPAAVKISIPTASKSGWANIIIDTRKPNATTINETKRLINPHKTNLNVIIHVSNSNKGKMNNATEPKSVTKHSPKQDNKLEPNPDTEQEKDEPATDEENESVPEPSPEEDNEPKPSLDNEQEKDEPATDEENESVPETSPEEDNEPKPSPIMSISHILP